MTSFKVYDDGGKDGDYSLTCNGTLILTAPTGYLLQLSGSLTTLGGDPLTVYDGSGNSGTVLLDIWQSDGAAITPVVSTGQSMTLCFSAIPWVSAAGLNFTVTLVSATKSSGITVNTDAHGTITASVGNQNATSATVNQTVTLTASPDEGYSLVSLSVTDAGGNAVVTDWEIYRNTATFRMPASDVTVTPTFSLTGAISQSTVTGLPDYVLHLNPSLMDVFQNIDVKVGDRTLTEGTDYTVMFELSDGNRYSYYAQNSAGHYVLMYLTDITDQSDPNWNKRIWKHGDVYDEKFVVIGKGIYEGQEKEFPYKRFFLDWDYDWNHVKGSRFLVRTADDLEHIAAAINSGLNMSHYHSVRGFILANDIDFSGKALVDTDNDGTPDSNFTPIGTADNPFNDTFIGSDNVYWSCGVTSTEFHNGAPPIGFAYRTISGIVCKTKDAPAGLFGCIGNGAKVSDVTLENCTFTATGTDAKAGAVAAVNGGSVERCLVKNSTVSGTAKGAIVGTNSGTLNRNYYTGCNSSASNIGTAAGDVAGARRDVGLTVPGSLSLSDGTASGLVFDGGVYGGAGETLTFYEETFDAYTTTGPVASFTHDIENYKYALAIRDDAAAAITINHSNHFGTDDGADGSEDHPYTISTTGGLDFLSKLVNEDPDKSDNSRYNFKDKFFKLGADIAYDPAVLTFDLDGDGANDSNYKPIAIGLADKYGYYEAGSRFCGSFDGDDHTISGIRINNPTGNGLGIFGTFGGNKYIGYDGWDYFGSLKNLTVSDTQLIGNGTLGGIVGKMDGDAITNCHTTSTVSLKALVNIGGIVGYQYGGNTSHCTSAVTIIVADADNADYADSFGGIAGMLNNNTCTLSHNLVIGATIGESGNIGCGGIVGAVGTKYTYQSDFNTSSLDHNYYVNCTVAGIANATGVGGNYWDKNYIPNYPFDFTENDGAVPVPSATVSKEGFGTYYISAADVVLPAGMKAMIVTGKDDGQALAYETIADGSTSTNTVPAGTAVMLQTDPAADKQTIGMTLAAPTDQRDFTATNLLHGSDVAVETSGGDLYYMLSYGKDGSERTNTLGWFWGADDGAVFTSAAHKAWLALKASAGARSFVLPVGNDNTTGIADDKSATHEPGTTNTLEQGAWYSLDGRKLNGRPTEKGVYIHNGRKEVIR